jgi:hypothetical protein
LSEIGLAQGMCKIWMGKEAEREARHLFRLKWQEAGDKGKRGQGAKGQGAKGKGEGAKGQGAKGAKGQGARGKGPRGQRARG